MNVFQRKFQFLICTALTLVFLHLHNPAFSGAEIVDVSGQVSVSTANERSTLDGRTNEVTSVADITVLNTSVEALALPIHAVFDLSMPQVDMPNALGSIGSPPYDTYYFDLSSLVPGNLNPGEEVTFQATFIRFYTVRFTYNVRVFAEQQTGVDLCPDDPEKTEPGVCGCGIPDIDTDNDGTFDCNDQCPNDPNKTEPGICGCGVADSDSNGNGILDCLEDNQPPALEIVEDKIVAEGSTLEVAIIAADPENDVITLAAPFLPAFCQFSDTGNGTGILIISPDYLDSVSSPYVVTITAADEPRATSTLSFSVAVTNVNRPPVLEPVSNQETVEGQELTFTLTGSDPDNDPLVFSAGNMVPGASLTEAGAFFWIPDFDQSGIHHIFFVLSDGEFSVEQQGRITVIDYNRTPVITTQDIPSAEINKLYKKSIQAADPDGDSLTFALTGGPPDLSIDPWSGQLVWRPALADMGEYSIQIQVSDNRGGTDSRQYALVVPDTIPPSVFLSAPALAIPGSSFTVSAQAADNDLVSSVTLEGAGFGSEQFLSQPYERFIQLPELAQVGTAILFVAIAVDPSGNTAEATVLVNIVGSPDITPPQVTLHAPTQAGQGQTILLTATAQDDVGVATVAFSLGDGTIIGSSPGNNARVLFTIAADAPLDSVLQFEAVAEDFSGHSAAAQATTLVVGEPDLTPPEPTGDIPDEVEEDEPLIVVVHTDNDTCLVEIYINHILAAVFTGPQNGSLSVPLPPGVEGNMEVPVEVIVTDCAANMTRQEDVVAILATGQGLITGEVYNDRTGLPLALAQLHFTTAGDEVVAGQTDQSGWFSLVADSGAGTLVISAAGFTTVIRSALVVPENTGIKVFDARLTPISASQPTASAVLGSVLRIPFSLVTAGFMPVLADKGQDPDFVATADIVLDIPGGSCTVDHDFIMTQISGQGLAGLLPGGWSPLGVVDIGPAAVSFLQSATLTMPNSLGISDPQGLVLSSWDEGSSAWRLVAAVTLSQDGSLIAGEIPSSGQYAFLLADLVPERPATVQPGELLAGVIPALVPEAADTSISPQPQIIFYQPGVYSDVGLNVSTGYPDLSSGTPLFAAISEEYDFYDGSRMTPAPYEQDIIGYSWNRTALTASWPVTPFMEFETLALRRGIIIVDALAPVDADRQISVAGPEGGTVSTTDGAVLRLPAGAVADLVPLGLNSLTAGDVTVEIPLEFDFLGGISLITADAVFGLPAQLTIPLPAGFADEGRIVLVSLEEVQGVTRFVLVGLGQVQGGTIVSIYELPGGNNRKLPGITRKGRYLFMQILSPTGFAAGRIYDTSAALLSGALITEESLSLISFSGTDGVYGALVPVGQFALTAQDTKTMDKGLEPGTILTAGDLVLLDIILQQEPPSVVSVDPQNTAENVALASAINVRFSEPLDPATVISDNVTLTGPQGQLAGTISLSSTDTVLTFRPTESLLPDTEYTFIISQGICDLAGHALGAVFTMVFSSLDTLPPPMPPAGSINATIPDGSGKTTISATQGTAGSHDTVSIINKTQGISTPVLVGADGSFSVAIDADIIDEVVISITDPAGNEISISIGRFENPDGSVVIGPEGGLLEADNGVILDIPAGAFPEGAIVKLFSLGEAEIGVDPGSDFPFVAGFEIECSESPQIYMNASAPLASGIDSSKRGIVAEVVEAFGEPGLSIVDTARIINGRLTTSSPPCPGLKKKVGRYGMFLNEDSSMATMEQALLSILAPVTREVVYQPMTFTETIGYGLSYSFMSYTSLGDVGLYETTYKSMCLPVPPDQSLKLMVRDANTWELIDIIDIDPISPGEHADIIIHDYNDTVGPKVVDVIPIQRTFDVHSRRIKVRFSEPISWESAKAITLIEVGGKEMVYDWGDPTQVEIVDQEGAIYEGKWSLSDNNCLLEFETDRALPMGRAFKLDLDGVRDLAGNHLEGPQIRFSTFEPYVVSPSMCAGGLTRNKIQNDLDCNENLVPSKLWFLDVDFSTKHPDESYDGKWHTDIIAIQGGDRWGGEYSIYTIDASDPTDLRVTAAYEADSTYRHRRVRLFDDLHVLPRGSEYADPQFWENRLLYYREDDPSNRICADSGSEELDAWVDRYCSFSPDDPEPPVCKIITGGCGDLVVTTLDDTQYSYLWSYDITDRNKFGLDSQTSISPEDIPIKWISSRLLSDNGVGYGNFRREEAPAGMGTAFGLDVATTPNFVEPQVGDAVAAYVANYGIGIELVDLPANIPTINDIERDSVTETLGLNAHLYYKDVSYIPGRVVDGDQIPAKVVAVAGDISGSTGVRTLEIFHSDLSGEPVNTVVLSSAPERIATVTDFPVFSADSETPELHDIAFVTGQGRISVVDIPADGGDYPNQTSIVLPSGVRTKHIQIDRNARVAYIAASDDDGEIPGDYLLIVDVSQPFTIIGDNNNDGWNDRVIGKNRITIPGYMGPVYLHGFRLDSKRGLIYAGIYAGGNEGLAIIKVRECPDVGVDFVNAPARTSVPEGVERRALQQVIRQGLLQAQSDCGIDPDSLTIIEQGSGACIWSDGPCSENYQPGISDHDFEIFFEENVTINARRSVIRSLYNQVMTIQSDPIPVVEEESGYTIYFNDISFYYMDREDFEDAVIDLKHPDPEVTRGDVLGDMGLGRQILLLKWLMEGDYINVPGLELEGKDFKEILATLKTPMDIDGDDEPDEPSHIPRLEGYEWARLQEAMIYNSGALIRIQGASEPGTTLNKTFQKELHKVAKAAIRAVFARIIANEEGNELAVDFDIDCPSCVNAGDSYDPYAWKTTDCCASFTHYIASLAARMVRDHPEVGLFTPEEVNDIIYRFYEIKSGLEVIETEEEAIEFITDAINFINKVVVETLPVYSQTIGIDPRAAQRLENMEFVESKIQEYKSTGKKQIIPRIVNKGNLAVDEKVWVRMYRDTEEVENKNIYIDPGSYVHLDTQKDPPIDNDDSDALLIERENVALFSFEVDQSDSSQSGWISFLADIPDNNIYERERENNWAKLFYYVLDPSNPAAPEPSTEPDITDIFGESGEEYLEPATMCTCERQPPPINVVQLINGISDPDSIVSVYTAPDGTRECFTIEVLVETHSDKDITNVKVFGEYGGVKIKSDEPVALISAGATVPVFLEYCNDNAPDEMQGTIWIVYDYEESDATGTRTLTSGQVANTLNLKYIWPIAIVPVGPSNPNPKTPEIMYGGDLYRYYELKNRKTGEPVSGQTIRMDILTPWDPLPGAVEFITDEYGTIGQQASGVFFEGVCVPWSAWNTNQIREIPYDAHIRVILKVKGEDIKVEPAEFNFELKQFTFDETMSAGANISILGQLKFLKDLAVVSGTLSGGAGLELGVSGYKDFTEHHDRFQVKGSRNRISVNFGPKIDFTKIGKTAKKELLPKKRDKFDLKLEVGANVGYSYTDGAQFDFELNDLMMLADKDALLAGLFLIQVQFANGKADPTIAHIFEKINSLVTQVADDTRICTFSDHSLAMSAQAEAGVELSIGRSGDESNDRGMKIEFAGGVQGDIKMGLVWSDEIYPLKNKSIESFTVSGELSAQAGLSVGLSNIFELDPVKHASLQQAIDKINNLGITTGIGSSIKQSLTYDASLESPPVELDVTVMSDKSFGYGFALGGLQNLGEGEQMSITYKIHSIESIRNVLQSMTEFSSLVGDSRKIAMEIATYDNLKTFIEIGPTKAHEKLVEFIAIFLGQDGVTYEIRKRSGSGDEYSFTPVKNLLGSVYKEPPVGIDIPIKIKTDNYTAHTVEKGAFANGKEYVLEQYQTLEVEPPSTGEVNVVLAQIMQRLTVMLVETIREVIRDPLTWVIRTLGSSQIHLACQEDFDAVIGPLAFDFEPIPGPVNPYYYAPWDVSGPAGKPHYGTGGFHTFHPTTHTLTQPATLIIDYHDEEIEGFDEATLAIYRWNEQEYDWDLVGGVSDADSNTVTAQITQLGCYTVAPAMPAGDLEWTVPVVVQDGGNVVVTLTSEQILTNSGSAVVDGTIFHVISELPYSLDNGERVPFGTIFSPDMQDDVEGVQVAVENGVIQVQAEYPGDVSVEARIVVYSDTGTAFGNRVIPLVVP